MKPGWRAWMAAGSDRTGMGSYGLAMRTRSTIFKKLLTVSARFRRAGLLALSAIFLAATASGQSTEKAAEPPRMPDGKPSFVGYWDLPYTPNMAAKDGEA